MQKLTLKRRVSGVHVAHAPDGGTLGLVDPGELELDDDELSQLMRKHAAKKAADGKIDEFLQRVNDAMKKTGAGYRQAMTDVSRADPPLASEYRARVLKSDLL